MAILNNLANFALNIFTSSKKKFLDVCTEVTSNINNGVYSAMPLVLEFVKNRNPKSRYNQATVQNMKKFMRTNKDKNPMEALDIALGNALLLIEHIKSEIIKSKKMMYVAEGITYKEASLFQLLNTINFFNDCSFFFSAKYIVEEIGANGNRASMFTFTPAQENKFNENSQRFYSLMSFLNGDINAIKKKLNEIPEVEVNADTSVLEATGSVNALDPLNMNLLPPNKNPFLHMALRKVESQIARRDKAVEERLALELLIRELSDALDKNPEDPSLTKSLAYRRNQLTKLNKLIEELEEVRQ